MIFSVVFVYLAQTWSVQLYDTTIFISQKVFTLLKIQNQLYRLASSYSKFRGTLLKVTDKLTTRQGFEITCSLDGKGFTLVKEIKLAKIIYSQAGKWAILLV